MVEIPTQNKYCADSLNLSSHKSYIILEPFNIPPVLGISLEIGARLALARQDVSYIHYGSCLPFVEWYQRNGCLKDRLLGYPPSPQVRGLNILKQIKNKTNASISLKIETLPPRVKHEKFYFESLRSLSQLKQIKYKHSIPLGLSVASSLVSIYRDPHLLPSQHVKLCNKLAKSFLISYNLGLKYLSANDDSALIVFNGRFACVNGAVEAARQLKRPVYFTERASMPEKFSLRNFHPHNREKLQADITRGWLSVNSIDHARQVAHNYYNQRRNSTNVDWVSFTSNHQPGNSYTVINQARRKSKSGKIIAYFASSDDEFVAVDDFYTSAGFEWGCQRDALALLINEASRHGHSVIVRVHPNLEKCSAREREQWNSLLFVRNLSNVVLVPSWSMASTYEILDSADLIASYGSTVGIEAVHWGKPSLLLGDSLYDLIGASVFKISSRSDLCHFLEHPCNWTVISESADSYGYYMATYGCDHLMYQPSSLFNGTFLGTDLYSYPKTKLHRLLDFVRRR